MNEHEQHLLRLISDLLNAWLKGDVARVRKLALLLDGEYTITILNPGSDCPTVSVRCRDAADDPTLENPYVDEHVRIGTPPYTLALGEGASRPRALLHMGSRNEASHSPSI